MPSFSQLSRGFSRDLTASIVVFLVAMPLCMGIAVASGVAPEKGLITGIIGGIIVGVLAGSPLQVSGPAAGLAVIVFELVRDHGLTALGPVLVLAGLLQFVAGSLKLGGWFRAISPAVVHGMLAGIGALIVVGQFHVLFDAKPLANGLENLAAMPGRLLGLSPTRAAPPELAFVIGIITILTMLGWERYRPASLRLVPGALMGVMAGTLVVIGLSLDVALVNVPDSIVGAIDVPTEQFFAPLASPTLMLLSLAIAFIASAETLLSAAAVDRMHDGPRTNYDKELRAQGVGNLLCGFAGALPMTGVIVRSSANVQAGALTRRSAILHGVWILAFVALLPMVLRSIPMAALGGILVVTGWRLVSLSHVHHLFKRYGPLPALVWAATFVMVLTTDLLTGVIVGMCLSLLELIPHAKELRLDVQERHSDDHSRIELAGTATFISLPKLSRVLDAAPHDRPLTLDLQQIAAIDHTCAEMLSEWLKRKRASGMQIRLTAGDKWKERIAHA